MRLGEYLKQKRINKGLTQEQLLEPTRKHQTNISKYENCVGYPSRQLIGHIAPKLGVNAEMLFFTVNNMKLHNVSPKLDITDSVICSLDNIGTNVDFVPPEMTFAQKVKFYLREIADPYRDRIELRKAKFDGSLWAAILRIEEVLYPEIITNIMCVPGLFGLGADENGYIIKFEVPEEHREEVAALAEVL
jgi:transcriptional regulator with XRE-family HTH domain